MVNSMDKSYAEQGTNCDEAFSFMDTHNLNGRCKCIHLLPSRAFLWFSRMLDSTGGFKKKKKKLPEEFLCPIGFSIPLSDSKNFSGNHGLPKKG